MATDTKPGSITIEQFLEMEQHAPEGVRWELIDGEIKEYPSVTTRNRMHSVAISQISYVLLKWLNDHEELPGVIAAGEARCKLWPDRRTMVGIDVGWFTDAPRDDDADESKSSYFDGPPVLAVEVLSGSEKHEDVVERIESFLHAGCRQVWVADPIMRTVTVYRASAPPIIRSGEQELDGTPELPEFRCRVDSLFMRTR